MKLLFENWKQYLNEATLSPQNIKSLANGGLLMLSATYCGPCKVLKADLEKLGVSFYYVDLDKYPTQIWEKALATIGVPAPLNQDGSPSAWSMIGPPFLIAFTIDGQHMMFQGKNLQAWKGGKNTWNSIPEALKRQNPELSDEEAFKKAVTMIVSLTKGNMPS